MPEVGEHDGHGGAGTPALGAAAAAAESEADEEEAGGGAEPGAGAGAQDEEEEVGGGVCACWHLLCPGPGRCGDMLPGANDLGVFGVVDGGAWVGAFCFLADEMAGLCFLGRLTGLWWFCGGSSGDGDDGASTLATTLRQRCVIGMSVMDEYTSVTS